MSKTVLGVVIAFVLLCLCVSLVCAVTGVIIGGAVLSSGDLDEVLEEFDNFFESGDFSYDYNSGDVDVVTTPIMVSTEEYDGVKEVAEITLGILKDEVVPMSNFDDLAVRLRGVGEVPAPPTSQVKFYSEGDTRDFNVGNNDDNTNFSITARLEKITEHAYFWIEDGIPFDENDLDVMALEFEEQIYPTNQAFFGSEWSPGIDGDSHIYILYVEGVGSSVAGYYSSADESHILANPLSNMVELFVMNEDSVSLNEEFALGVLAHEYQHMIHWNLDSNETSWLNEGFAELAAYLNGYNPGGHEYTFMRTPDYQLNNWPADGNTSKNYGASFLFANYLLSRLGEENTRAIVANTNNGFDSIDAILVENDFRDDVRGELLTADDLVIDWMVTNLLLDDSVSNGRFDYVDYRNAPQADATDTIWPSAGDEFDYSVNQYGADYIEVDAGDGFSMHFQGGDFTTLLELEIQDGDFAFWSNKGDGSDMRLTGAFDFRDVSEPLTLKFSTWYDIEEGWDYVYLVYSEDGGSNWKYLSSENGTSYNPQGNNFGFGWSSTSDGWVDESINISNLAGKEVLLRFEYVTDAAVNNEGMLIDDLRIPEIGYATSFETDDPQWDGEGFARVNHMLPQRFSVAAIVEKDGMHSVEYLTLDENGFDYEMGAGEADTVTFVVSGTTRFTRQKATYTVSFE